MKRIPLHARDGSIREWALVDDEDYEWLMQWAWSYRKPCGPRESGYAQRSEYSGGGQRVIKMHRLILNVPPHMDVDHRNRNGLDNQRSNLRPCTNSQNHGNQGLSHNNKSGYKGVSWNKQARKWQVHFYEDGRRRNLGQFSSVEDAARAYDKAALEKWGEFALLNFPATSSEDVA